MAELRELRAIVRSIETVALTPLASARRRFARAVVDDEAASLLERTVLAAEEERIKTHHLAVHYHAKALDLAAQDSEEMERAFRKAHAFWSALLGDDAFWQQFVALGRAGSDRFRPAVVSDIRGTLAYWILSVHKDRIVIAEEDVSMRSLARRHVRLLIESPFPEASRRCRTELVALFSTRGLNAGEKALNDVADRIGYYCDCDPENVLARAELLAVLAEVAEKAAVSRNDLSAVAAAVARARLHKQELETLVEHAGAELPARESDLARATLGRTTAVEAYLHFQRKGRGPALHNMVQQALEGDPTNHLATWLKHELER